MDLNYKTTLDMSGPCAYSLDEIVSWCTHYYGPGGFSYQETKPNVWIFNFATNREMVRFGLTWNKMTIKNKPKPYY